MTDAARLADPLPALDRLPPGSAVILRHYDAPDRRPLAAKVAARCRQLGLKFLVAGAWRLAAHVGADGLHLAAYLARRGPEPGARLWLKRKTRFLTVAAHGARGLARARFIRADAALLSPVFATASHPGVRPLGLTRAAMLIRAARLPVMALGGIALEDAHMLRGRGFAGVAGIGFGIRSAAERRRGRQYLGAAESPRRAVE